MKSLSLYYPAGVLLGFSIGAGCRIPHPNHCSANEGNASCAAGGQGTYCNECQMENDGCVNEMPAEGCYFPGPSEDASTSDDGLTSSEATTAPQPPSSGSPEGSTGTTPCTTEEDCADAGAPFCDTNSGECVACDAMADANGACAVRDPDAPLCVGGECVQCTPEHTTVCDADLRVCDPGSNSCVACTEHDQCSSGACELVEGRGRCFPLETLVVHVDGDGERDHTSIYNAVMDVDEGGSRVIVVHAIDGEAPYVEGVVIDAGKTIALLAAEGELPVLQGAGGDPGLRVEGETTVLYTAGLYIQGNTNGRGLEVDLAGLAWIDRSRIVQNLRGGILAHGGGELRLRNSFVGNNGAGGSGSYGVEVQDAVVQILYSTVVRNDEMTVDSISCSGSTSVDVRNSIVVGRDPNSIDCLGITVTDSALDESMGINAVVGAADLGWFIDGVGGDYHLTPAGALVFADIAHWVEGDPPLDIDGDARLVDGVPDYAGADRP